jgi:hypothetical protein
MTGVAPREQLTRDATSLSIIVRTPDEAQLANVISLPCE